MGAQACKCECDADKKNDAAAGGAGSASAYAEEVESKTPKIVDAPAPEAKKDSRPPEQTGAEDPSVKACAPPELRVLTFEIEAGKPLGARFGEIVEPKAAGGTLIATSISEKSALAWTKEGSGGICCGDTIVKVGAEGGGKQKLLEMLTQAKKAGGPVEIQVRPRPATFTVELQKNDDEKMGIVVAVHDDITDRVEVRQVASEDGAVPQWNEKNYMNQVVSGDWVVAVNGQTKPANDMIQDLQESWQKRQPLSFTIMSYPTQEMRDAKKK